MAIKDKFHDVVKTALLKEHWNITDDPLRNDIKLNKSFMIPLRR
jgi:hypothetical protein